MLQTPSITTFRCEECNKNFWPENGGRCDQCGRFLCARHLFGWKFWRASTASTPTCQRCRQAESGKKHAGGNPSS